LAVQAEVKSWPKSKQFLNYVAKTIAGELPLLEMIFSTTDIYELRFVTIIQNIKPISLLIH
jgi:hypothetical protein